MVTVVLFFLLFIYVTLSKPNYCIPTDSCWPTFQDVVNLNLSLSANALLLNSSDTILYNKFSTIQEQRFYSYPAWILVASTTSDIQSGVKFAALYNIQISILNTGHSYTGRNTANNSLMIQVSQLKYYNLSSDNNFITISAGNTWGEIYSFLNKSSINKLIMGGSDKSVGVTGGYSQGGGHGWLTPHLGLSCDWIQSFTMVDSKGEIQIVSNTSTDINIRNLYWALRGGGGGTFGIVVDATFKLHDPLNISPTGQFTFYQAQWSFFNLGFPKTLTANTTLNGIWYWMKWMAFIFVQPIVDVKYKGIITVTSMYADTIDKAKINSEYLANLSVSSKVTPDLYAQGDNLNDGFLQLFSNNSSPMNVYLFSGLVQNESLNEHYTDLNIDLILNNNIMETGFSTSNTMVVIGGSGNNDVNKNSSVHPLWRSARLILGVAGGTGANSSVSTVNSMTDYVKKTEMSWSNVSDGVYSNEENNDCMSCKDNPVYDGQWGNAFWGEGNYQKLMQIKKQWDPNNVFWCFHCVGDD